MQRSHVLSLSLNQLFDRESLVHEHTLVGQHYVAVFHVEGGWNLECVVLSSQWIGSHAARLEVDRRLPLELLWLGLSEL